MEREIKRKAEIYDVIVNGIEKEVQKRYDSQKDTYETHDECGREFLRLQCKNELIWALQEAFHTTSEEFSVMYKIIEEI